MIYVFFFFINAVALFIYEQYKLCPIVKLNCFPQNLRYSSPFFHPSSFYFAHYNYRFFVCFFLLCFHVIRNLFFHFFYYYYCVTFSVILRLLRVKLTFFVLNNCLSPILFSGFFFWWPSELLLLGVKKKKDNSRYIFTIFFVT